MILDDIACPINCAIVCEGVCVSVEARHKLEYRIRILSTRAYLCHSIVPRHCLTAPCSALVLRDLATETSGA